MDFDTALSTLSRSDADAIRENIARLPQRQQQAILSETRLPPEYWQSVLEQLKPLAPNADVDHVRHAISAALKDVYLTGPDPHPQAERCERALDFERLFEFYRKELNIEREPLMDHFDDWSLQGRHSTLNACISLVGHLKTGMCPTWGVPFAAGDPRPLEGLSAEQTHARLALWPPGERKPKVIMTYALPNGTRQAVPNIGDALQWNEDKPHWRYLFLPAHGNQTLGWTAPVDPGLAGFPEIVHEPVELSNLLAPLERRT